MIKIVAVRGMTQCSENLIEKEGRFGKFYGYSNYPKCRFTKKL